MEICCTYFLFMHCTEPRVPFVVVELNTFALRDILIHVVSTSVTRKYFFFRFAFCIIANTICTQEYSINARPA